jgi:adenylate cyclase
MRGLEWGAKDRIRLLCALSSRRGLDVVLTAPPHATYRRGMGAAEFRAAGLYDPTAPNAADRLALLQWLLERGATIEEMVRAERQGGLNNLVAPLVLRPGRYLTLAEVAERAGLTPAQVEEMRFAAGLPPVDPDDRRFSEADVQSFVVFANGERLFGEAATLRFAGVIGSSSARIAEAAVALFRVHVEGPLREAQRGELPVAEAQWQATEMARLLPTALESVFLGHFETAIRRLSQARHSIDTVTRAVGFVDLVGFTTVSGRLEPRELAALVERFEDTAHDVATAHDGRVVKLIGDEVMFVAVEATSACEIALALVERLCRDSDATPRGGLAFGELLVRGGDYYGPVVNLAARIAELAVPNELLVTSEVAAHARDNGLRFEPAGRRMLKGFDAPVALMTLERRPFT